MPNTLATSNTVASFDARQLTVCFFITPCAACTVLIRVIPLHT